MAGQFNPYFSSIPPRRDLKHLLVGFETRAKALVRKDALEKALHAAGYAATAKILANCKSSGYRRYPCLSATCPVCLRALRRWFFAATTRLLDHVEKKSGRGHLIATIIPSRLQCHPGRLSRLSLAKLRTEMWLSLDRLNLSTPVIGGVDISYNVDALNTAPPHWQPHVSYVFAGLDTHKEAGANLHQSLAKAFRVEPTANRPIRVDPLVDASKQVSYLLKAVFDRRITVISRATGKPIILHRGLQPAQMVEVSEWLSSDRLTGRFLLYGVRRTPWGFRLSDTKHSK